MVQEKQIPEWVKTEAWRCYPNDDEFNKTDRDRFMDGALFAIYTLQSRLAEVERERERFAMEYARWVDGLGFYLNDEGTGWRYNENPLLYLTDQELVAKFKVNPCEIGIESFKQQQSENNATNNIS